MSISKFHYFEPVRVISKEGDLIQIYDQNSKVIAMEIEGHSEWHYTIEIEGRRWIVAESALESVKAK